jgi:hypothetical protein
MRGGLLSRSLAAAAGVGSMLPGSAGQPVWAAARYLGRVAVALIAGGSFALAKEHDL